MTGHKIFIENEEQANRLAAKVMRITFLIFTFVYLLDILGIFIIDLKIMTGTYAVSAMLLFLPTVLIDLMKKNDVWIKYLNVILAAAFIVILSITLTYHVVVLYVYPIAIANLYFSRKLNIMATVLTVIGVSIGQLAAFYLGILQDNNFLTLDYVLMYGILPRALVLVAMAAIFTLLSERTAKMLRNLLEAEEELKDVHKEMVMGFATLVENKDGSTGGHIKRTTNYVKLLTQELRNKGIYTEELTDEYLEDLYRAAPMHDIGKISVPDIILQKPGKLTDEEFEVIKTHTVKGGEIIRDTFGHLENESYTKVAYEVARHHHEKWNGRGYPDQLREKEIPLCARIMAIADVFDAVSEKRCYRDAMPLDKCFSIIEEGRGQSFDPVLVDVFLEIRDKVAVEHGRINIL